MVLCGTVGPGLFGVFSLLSQVISFCYASFSYLVFVSTFMLLCSTMQPSAFCKVIYPELVAFQTEDSTDQTILRLSRACLDDSSDSTILLLDAHTGFPFSLQMMRNDMPLKKFCSEIIVYAKSNFPSTAAFPPPASSRLCRQVNAVKAAASLLVSPHVVLSHRLQSCVHALKKYFLLFNALSDLGKAWNFGRRALQYCFDWRRGRRAIVPRILGSCYLRSQSCRSRHVTARVIIIWVKASSRAHASSL